MLHVAIGGLASSLLSQIICPKGTPTWFRSCVCGLLVLVYLKFT